MKPLRKQYLLIPFLCFPFIACAVISLRFKNVTISSSTSSQYSFSNYLYIINHDQQAAHLELLSGPSDISFFNLPQTLDVKAGDSLNLFIKFLSYKRNIPFQGKKIQFIFLSNRTDTIAVDFQMTSSLFREIQLSSNQHTILLSQHQKKFDIPIKIYNNGNIEENITARLHECPAWKIANNVASFSLPPFSDTMISLHVTGNNLPEEQQNLPLLQIIIQDSAMQLRNVIAIPIIQITDNIDFSDRQQNPNNNFMAMQTGGIGAKFKYKELELAYNKDINEDGFFLYKRLSQYTYNKKSQYFIRDNFIGYKAKQLNIKAGTINYYGETAVFGQGISATLLSKKIKLHAAYLANGNAHAYSNTTFSNPKKTILLNIEKKFNSYVTLKIHSLYQWNSFLQPDFFLSGCNFISQNKKNDQLETGIFISKNTSKSENNLGMSTSFRLSGKRKNFSFLSDNYYSTPEYRGLLRNMIRMNEMIIFPVGKSNMQDITFQINYLRVRNNFFGRNSANIFFQKDLFLSATFHCKIGGISLGVNPYYTRQQFGYNTLTKPLTLESWRANLTLSGPFLKSFYAFCSADISLQQKQSNTLSNVNKNSLPLKIVSTVSHQWGGIQAIIQNKAFFAMDLLNERNTTTSVYQFLIGPFLNLKLFHNKLLLNGGYNYQVNARKGPPVHYCNVSVKNHISKTLLLYANFIYYKLNSYKYQDLRIGIQINFGNINKIFHSYKKVIFFDDINSNGIKDQQEAVIPELLFAARNTMVQTDRYGSVKLLNYKGDNHILDMVNGRGYNLPDHWKNITYSKKINFIPMHKTGILNGSVEIIQPKYLNHKIDLAEIPINLISTKGKVYTYFTDASGKFTAFLPNDRYIIKVDPKVSLSFEMPKETIVVIDNNNRKNITIILAYKTRESIEIKRFTKAKSGVSN